MSAHVLMCLCGVHARARARWRTARLEEHKRNTAKVLAEYQKDNSLVYFEAVLFCRRVGMRVRVRVAAARASPVFGIGDARSVNRSC